MVAFVECAHEGKPAPVGVADGRAAYLIGKAAKQSMETGLVSKKGGVGRGDRYSNNLFLVWLHEGMWHFTAYETLKPFSANIYIYININE